MSETVWTDFEPLPFHFIFIFFLNFIHEFHHFNQTCILKYVDMTNGDIYQIKIKILVTMKQFVNWQKMFVFVALLPIQNSKLLATIATTTHLFINPDISEDTRHLQVTQLECCRGLGNYGGGFSNGIVLRFGRSFSKVGLMHQFWVFEESVYFRGLLGENVSLGLNQIAMCCVYSVCVCKGRYHEKRCCSFGFCPNYFPAAPPPSPQFGQLVQLFSDV